MKKSVIALILLAVLIIIVSPGIVGKLAENSVGESLNWAAEESGEIVVTSDAFDRGQALKRRFNRNWKRSTRRAVPLRVQHFLLRNRTVWMN